MNQSIVFQMKNPGALPLPTFLVYFMVAIFGLPAVMVVATTFKEVPQYPWLILVYIAACFPLLVLYAVKQLMGKYALRVYGNGDVEIVYPFKKVRLLAANLHSVAVQSTYIASQNTRRRSVVLGSHDGKVLASFSPDAFGQTAMEQFFHALHNVNAAVVIQK